MKTFFSTVCLAPALLMLASCGMFGGGGKTASAPQGVQEFDQATGTWKQATKIVQPPAPQQSAPLPVIASQIPPEAHEGVMHKMGTAAKKPLHWIGLSHDDPTLPPVPPAPAKTGAVAGKPDAPAPQRLPTDPRPGAKSLWQSIGETMAKPFHWVGL